MAELAAILAELKTGGAQAAVDERRSTSALADAVAAESFDEAKGESHRGRSSQECRGRVQDAVAKALGRIHKASCRAEGASWPTCCGPVR